jgi:predicted RNA-binding Zn-ribbon protein involved in translation (DUF1610 family)
MTFAEYMSRKRRLFWRVLWGGVLLTCVASFPLYLRDSFHHVRGQYHTVVMYVCTALTIGAMTLIAGRLRCPKCGQSLHTVSTRILYLGGISACPHCGLRADDTVSIP